MEVKARVYGKPVPYFLLFMSGVIVGDAVNVHPPGCGLVDLSQEFEKLLMPMAEHAFDRSRHL